MYTLLVKVFNSSKFDNQRSAQVLTNTSEEVPDFINWHKNYAKACGLKNGRCYIITVERDRMMQAMITSPSRILLSWVSYPS